MNRITKPFLVSMVLIFALFAKSSSGADEFADTVAYFTEARTTGHIGSRELSSDDKPMYLDKMVVTANRFEENENVAPQKITSISKEQIALLEPQTAADVLTSSSEVFVQKSQMGGGSPMIRGFSANRVLLVVDGIRMNNAIYRSGNIHNIISMDPQNLEEVEVLFGPASTMYGSDALGGVFHLQTKTPTLSAAGSSVDFKTNVLTRFASANGEKTGHADISASFEKWALLSSVTYNMFDDLKMGKNGDYYDDYKNSFHVIRSEHRDEIKLNERKEIQKNSGYNQINLMEKLLIEINRHAVLTTGFFYSKTSDIPRYDRLVEYYDSVPKYGEWYYGPQKWMLGSIELDLSYDTPLFERSCILVGYQSYRESRHDRKFGKPDLRSRTERVKMGSVNADFMKKIHENHDVSYGLEVVYNAVDSEAEKKNIETNTTSAAATRYPDEYNHYANGALYIHYQGQCADYFYPSAGLRYSYTYLKSGLEERQFYSFPFDEISLRRGSLSGSLGLVYLPGDFFKIQVNAGSGYRAPNLDDVGKVFDSEPGHVVVPNPDLKPEYAYNVDVGITVSGERFETEVTGFATAVDNIMARDLYTFNNRDSILYDNQMSRVEALINKDHAVIGGFHLSVKLVLTSYLNLHSHLGYTYGEDSAGEPLRHVAPLFGSTAMRMEYGAVTGEIKCIYNGEIETRDLAASEKNKPHLYASDTNGNPFSPAWSVVNVHMGYAVNKHIRVNTGIENIFDKAYRPYSSGISGPGRNFVVSLRASF